MAGRWPLATRFLVIFMPSFPPEFWFFSPFTHPCILYQSCMKMSYVIEGFFETFCLKINFKKDLNVAYMDFQFSDRLHQCLLLYLMPIPWLLLLCPPKKSPEWYRSWSSLSVKVQIANTFSFVGHGVSVPATQVCSYSMKVVRDEVKLNGCVRSNKILFPK